MRVGIFVIWKSESFRNGLFKSFHLKEETNNSQAFTRNNTIPGSNSVRSPTEHLMKLPCFGKNSFTPLSTISCDSRQSGHLRFIFERITISFLLKNGFVGVTDQLWPSEFNEPKKRIKTRRFFPSWLMINLNWSRFLAWSNDIYLYRNSKDTNKFFIYYINMCSSIFIFRLIFNRNSSNEYSLFKTITIFVNNHFLCE